MLFKNKEDKEISKQIKRIYKRLTDKRSKIPLVGRYNEAMDMLYLLYSERKMSPDFLIHRKNTLDEELNRDGSVLLLIVVAAISLLLGMFSKEFLEIMGNVMPEIASFYAEEVMASDHLKLFQRVLIGLMLIGTLIILIIVYITAIVAPIMILLKILSRHQEKSKNELKQFELDLIEDTLKGQYDYDPSHLAYMGKKGIYIEREETVTKETNKKKCDERKICKYKALAAVATGISCFYVWLRHGSKNVRQKMTRK